MDLEEAKIKSRITPEEENSIGKYINFGHTQINELACFDVLRYFELANKGWLLSGTKDSNTQEPKDSEELGESILKSIEDFANVYSVMYKYSKTARCPSTLYRGTSNAEARKLKTGDTYDKLISTTTDSITAKTFMEYGNAGFLRIRLGEDMPFLDVDEFVGKENINREEHEFILAPFSKITNAEYSYKDNEISYYNIRLGKPEVRAFEEGEKEKFREKIKTEFAKIIELGKEYQKLVDGYEIDSYRLQRAQDREDIKFLQEKMERDFNHSMEIKPILDEFSETMKNYTQGLCFEKQKEFEEANKIVEDDRKKQLEEEKARRAAEQRKEEISEYNMKLFSINENLSFIPSNIDFNYNDLKLKAENFSRICSNLGIPFNSEIDTKLLESYINKIRGNINIIKEKTDLSAVSEDTSSVNFENLETLRVYEALLRANSISGNLGKAVQVYDKQSLDYIKEGVDHKIQGIIQRAKIEQLERKKEEVASRKVSFLGQITGQKNLKELELHNLELQIEFEKTKPILKKNNYSIHDSLADMIVFSNENLEGRMNSEMQDFYYAVTSNFGVNKDYIERLAYEKVMAKPAVITPSDKMHVSERIAELDENNRFLQQGIQANNYQNRNATFANQYDNKQNRGISQFVNCLDDILNCTNIEDKTQENLKIGRNEKIEEQDNSHFR